MKHSIDKYSEKQKQNKLKIKPQEKSKIVTPIADE
jgi:hypothetical protein